VQDLWPESLQVTGFVNDKKLLAAVRVVVEGIYRANDLLLVQSEAFVVPVRALAGTTPVIVHPNPGERAFQTRCDGTVPPSLRLGEGFQVVFAGNLGTVQALDTVLDAAERLRGTDVRFTLVGSGSRSAWVADQVERRGLDMVTLAGRFPPEAMPGILDQASALLVTLVKSAAMSQTIPSKVQAYLAAGRPVIAALDGEGARVVEAAGAGVACPAEDAVALAAAVTRLRALSLEERNAMGERGRLYYEKYFDGRRLAGVLLETLVGVVEQRRERA
jgi:glycosyltransferase involved in cell wall biosynthesis